MEVLARLFYGEARARDLLEQAEIPWERLPSWSNSTAEMFWRSVLRELENGLVPRGRERLLRAASERYPGNEELKALLGEVPEIPSIPEPTPTTPRAEPPPSAPPPPSRPQPSLDINPWLDHIHSVHGQLPQSLQQGSKLALRHIYVELQLMERETFGERDQLTASGGRRSLEEILALEPGRDGDWITRRWLLVGDPGSGKTTLLRHLAMTLAARGLSGEPTWIPVFESLPRLLRDTEGAVHYPEFLAAQLHRVAGGDVAAWIEELDHLASSGRLLLLLDGLDEVGPKERRRVEQLISGVASRRGWQASQIVVTTRPIGGYRPGSRFQLLSILPFSESDRREFLARWLGTAEQQNYPLAEETLSRFQRDASVWELSGNPLYLTLLGLLVKERIEIPERRSELYTVIFDFLLEGRHRSKASPIRPTWVVESVLEELSWILTQEGVDAEPILSLERRLDESPSMRQALSSSEEWARQSRVFLDAVAKKTSILGPHDGEGADWRYWHRTFREALAAKRLKALYERDGEAALLAHARECTGEDAGRWAEPYALVAGSLQSPDRLVLSLVETNEALGLRSLATVPGLKAATVGAILERLGEPKAASPTSWFQRTVTSLGRVFSRRRGEEFEISEEDWEKRAQVYRRIPDLLGDAKGSLDLLERLRRDTQEPHDLFFLEEAMVEVGKRWPESQSEVSLRRSRFFDHLPPPPRDLFEQIVVPSSDEPVSVWREISPGGFLMGSPSSEPDYDAEKAPLGAYGDERPQHEVRFTRPFRMMSTPVTNAQYLAFNSSHEVESWGGVSDSEVLSHPVVNVSWYEACVFCRWLSRGGFPGARLPSESEWEYICRAGTPSRFWSGDSEEDLARVGWYDSNSDGRTHRVGALGANPWGLYDVHGNVWEWCADAWDFSGYFQRASSAPLVDPPVTVGDVWNTQETRVLRGGSWARGPGDLRAAFRGWVWSWHRHGDVGFRVLLCRFPEP